MFGLFVFGAALAALAGLYILVTMRSLIHAVDGFSLALPLIAVGIRPALTGILERRAPRHLAWLAFPLLCSVGLTWSLSQNTRTRSTVIQSSYTAKYMFHKIQKWSDFDGDGSPSFPVSLDCAPFNAKIRPYAKEIPGNGIDEDCDGLDILFTGYLPPKRTRPRRSKVDPKPDIVLITIDAVRADHLGVYGYERPTSPNLDAFAKEATVFQSAFSQDSGTGPSLWSLMVGKTPFQTSLRNAHRFPPQFAPSEVTMTQTLRKEGYETSALLCGSVFGTPHWNLKKGFAKYREICGKSTKPSSSKVTRQALKELKRLRKGKKPFFLWVHYYDPHGPYTNHKDQDLGSTKIDFYDEEITFTDREMGPFLEALPGQEKHPTYVFITADHGENFGEHGKAPHARNLYWEVTRVPLIVRGPDVQAQHIDATVAMNDIFPTVLELAGAPESKVTTMISMVPVLMGDPPDEQRLVFQENSYSRPRRHTKGVVGRGYHMIYDISNEIYELYDIKNDTKEQHDLAGSDLQIEKDFLKALRGFIPTTDIPKGLSR